MADKAKATLRLNLASKTQLSTVLNALGPEVKKPITRRAIVKLGEDGSFIVLTIEAEDTTALRSTINAYLRWIGSMLDVISLIEHG